MIRALGFLLILALLVVLALSLGWLDLSSYQTQERSAAEVSINTGEIERDVSEAGDAARNWVADATERRSDEPVAAPVADSATPALKVDKYAIELEAGGKTEVIVTRIGTSLPEGRLQITTTPNSNLMVSGGEFESGQRNTTIVIEAPMNAKGGRVDMKFGEAQESVTVEVEEQPAAVFDPELVWPPPAPTYKF